MSMKNLVYNKLARQNIFCFINSILILVILTYIYHYCYSSCSSSYYYCYYYYHYYFYYYYHYHYYFIVIIVIIIIVLSIINVIHFILFNFISYCSYYYGFYLPVVCDAYVTPRIFFLFLLMIYILYSSCSYMSRIIFLLSLSFISSS